MRPSGASIVNRFEKSSSLLTTPTQNLVPAPVATVLAQGVSLKRLIVIQPSAQATTTTAMPIRLDSDIVKELLQRHAAGNEPVASSKFKVVFTDVFIAGSGPIGSTYARSIIDNHPTAKVLMAEIGSQDSPIIGAHHKNSVKYQKDIDSFVNVIKGALQPVSVPPGDTLQTTLAVDAWAPPLDPKEGVLIMQGNNPSQVPGLNLRASAITRTVGGMATHWTCCCPIPHEEESVNNPTPRKEFLDLLKHAGQLLNVHDDQYDDSIRHTVVKEALEKLPKERGLGNLPLGVERRKDNPEYVTWTGSNTILGKTASNPRFELRTETRVTRLVSFANDPTRVGAAWVRDLNTNDDVLVIAKAFIVCCGAIGNPQVLWHSNIRPHALGRYLSEQSMAFCQIVLKREIVESIPDDPRFRDRVKKHKQKHPGDPLPIPFNDPEPQVNIPYTSEHPWHVQVHRDAFSYGDVGPKADPRVVVDLRFFGKSDIKEYNRVSFGDEPTPYSEWEAGITDIYGMPQPTFHVERTKQDGLRDQKMMNDMSNVANMLGGYLPGSYPQFMEPGLALHITGTTRIGTNPKTSVADPESRVHDFKNLWVGGNSVIPDATACNPTRTSVAYALKGADAVVQYLKERGSD